MSRRALILFACVSIEACSASPPPVDGRVQEPGADAKVCILNAAVAPPPPSVVRVFLIPGGQRCFESRDVASDGDLTRLAREHASGAPEDAAVVNANADTAESEIRRAVEALRAGGIRKVDVSIEGNVR